MVATTYHSVGSEAEFVKREISIWGEDYIFDLIDKGFVPTLLNTETGLRWTWRVSINRSY